MAAPGGMTAGPVKYKRKFKLWILILLIIVCWPVAIIYYFTRPKVPVQELHPVAPMASQPMAASAQAPAAAAPTCPKCGQPATYIAQYGRWYCHRDQTYL